jgi:phospholipid transport system substrate-binding protein
LKNLGIIRSWSMALVTGFFLVLISVISVQAEGAAAEANPAPALDDAKLVINQLHADLLTILKRSEELGLEGRAKELKPILNESMNLLALGVGAVGRRNWRAWDQSQRDQFIDVFLEFMAASYAARFKSFNNQKFTIVGDRPGPRGSVILLTQVDSEARDTTNVDYLMMHRNDRWAIADIFLDGAISEVAMRRSEFSNILRSEGFEALVVAIRKKTAARLTP